MRYLITFSCYGSHIHGDELGSVDRQHNRVGGPLAGADLRRARAVEGRMLFAPYLMQERDRTTVLEAAPRDRETLDQTT